MIKKMSKNLFKYFLIFGACIFVTLIVLAISYPKTYNYVDYRIGMSFPFYGVQKLEKHGISYLERNHCNNYREECHCMVLFHGVGETANSWGALLQASSSDWLYPVRIISVNIPEATYLAINGVEKNLKDISNSYLQILNQECTSKTIVGNSLGGMIVSRMAIDNQDKIDSLVLINAAGLPGNYDYVKNILNSAKAADFADFYEKTYFSPPTLPKFFWNIVESFVWNKRSIEKIFPQDEIPDLISHAEFSTLTLPTLIMWGKEDRVLPDFAPEFQRTIASSEINYLDDCAHVPQKECPEAVIKGLKRVIKSIR